MPRKYKKQTKDYAADYGVDPRTIRNWKAADYPLDDPGKMAEVIAAQKNQPSSAKAPELNKAKLEKVRLECVRLQLDIAVRKREFIPANKVREDCISVGAVFDAELSSLLNDMPGVLAGLSEANVRAKLAARIGALKSSVKQRLASISA